MADEFKVTIPDKQPYEGRATQKQKQKLWDLGYRDQRVIDDLGKRQASVLIDAILSRQKGRTAGPLIACGLIFALVGGAVFHFYHGDRATAVSAFVSFVGIVCGGLMLLTGLFRVFAS